MKTIIKSCLVLCIISSVCVTALAYVNKITAEPIKRQEKRAEMEAYVNIFPEADDFRNDETAPPEGGAITGITTAYKDGVKAGYIVKLSQKGYGGTIVMLVGIESGGAVSGIEVISHAETAGLGANCEKDWFTDKFKGKTKFPLTVAKSGSPKDNEIDALTSATITTKAVTNAVNTAYEWYEAEGGGK